MNNFQLFLSNYSNSRDLLTTTPPRFQKKSKKIKKNQKKNQKKSKKNNYLKKNENFPSIIYLKKNYN
jgi:GTP cyclohydrolase I